MTAINQRIMVQVADREWTQEALYRASVLARKGCGDVVIVHMLAVQHLGWLGTDFGYMALTERERIDLKNYEATVEDYGVPYSTQIFQYFALAEAIVDAAEYVCADVVFATLPRTIIPYWQEIQFRKMRHRLMMERRVLVERKSILPEHSHG